MKILSMSKIAENIWSVQLDNGETVRVFCRDGQDPEEVLKESEPE